MMQFLVINRIRVLEVGHTPPSNSTGSTPLGFLPTLVTQFLYDPKVGLLVGYVILEKGFGVYWEFSDVTILC